MALSREERNELERTIDERYARLTAATHEHASRSRDESYGDVVGGVPDTGDEAVADLLSDLDTAEVARDVREIRDLEAAKERLAGGTYGLCIDCGGDIAADRLRAYPTAKRCVVCQAVHERTYAEPPRPTL